MTDTRDSILGEIETLIGRYLVAETPHANASVMVTGFVFKASARTFRDGEHHKLTGWAASEDQDTHLTLGLAMGLGIDAQEWYADVMSGSLTDDDDE